MATDNRGLGSSNMSENEKHKIQSKGGKASSAKQDMSELGKKGAEAQPTEAKRRGGENSHGGGR
jgi:hypothetical protein